MRANRREPVSVPFWFQSKKFAGKARSYMTTRAFHFFNILYIYIVCHQHPHMPNSPAPATSPS